MKLYVGNLSYSTDNDGLKTAFERFGSVESAEVVFDRFENRSKGFGFVVMPNSEEARAAIAGMDGQTLDGRPLKVSEARPRRDDFGGGPKRY